jgi:uncharacterized membrane protein
METKKSKYDTNPLDPDVERKAHDVWGDLGGATPTTQQVGGATREVADSPNAEARRNVYSEAPTRRYDNPPLEAPYPSIFVPPTYAPPAQQQYQEPRQFSYQSPLSIPSTCRSVAGLGIPERWALLLAYFPYIGLVASIIELLLAPRREIKVRFHAAQALALHIAILMISTVLGAIAAISDGGGFGSGLFRTAASIFLIISMIRVWRGEPHRIAPLEEPGKWFNQHIEPRTQA